MVRIDKVAKDFHSSNLIKFLIKDLETLCLMYYWWENNSSQVSTTNNND
jgi:hypothetical protein